MSCFNYLLVFLLLNQITFTQAVFGILTPKEGRDMNSVVRKLQDYMDGIEDLLKDTKDIVHSSSIKDETQINNEITRSKDSIGDKCANAGPDEEDIDLCICTNYPDHCIAQGNDIVEFKTDSKRGVDKNKNILWKKEGIPVTVIHYTNADAAHSATEKANIGKAIDAFNKEFQNCIKWEKKTNEDDYIKFIKDSGCYSYIGRRNFPEGQDISIGQNCDTNGVIWHEMYHAMGFYHEQSRTDRDDYITIKFENIDDKFRRNFNKGNTNLQYTKYDYSSILHYSKYAFTKNGAATIETKNKETIGNRRYLSAMDKYELRKIYGCTLKCDNDNQCIPDKEVCKNNECVDVASPPIAPPTAPPPPPATEPPTATAPPNPTVVNDICKGECTGPQTCEMIDGGDYDGLSSCQDIAAVLDCNNPNSGCFDEQSLNTETFLQRKITASHCTGNYCGKAYLRLQITDSSVEDLPYCLYLSYKGNVNIKIVSRCLKSRRKHMRIRKNVGGDFIDQHIPLISKATTRNKPLMVTIIGFGKTGNNMVIKDIKIKEGGCPGNGK